MWDNKWNCLSPPHWQAMFGAHARKQIVRWDKILQFHPTLEIMDYDYCFSLWHKCCAHSIRYLLSLVRQLQEQRQPLNSVHIRMTLRSFSWHPITNIKLFASHYLWFGGIYVSDWNWRWHIFPTVFNNRPWY